MAGDLDLDLDSRLECPIIVEWLNSVRDGLGMHACVFVAYGIKNMREIKDMDAEDIADIKIRLEGDNYSPKPAPFDVKQLVKALKRESVVSALHQSFNELEMAKVFW